MKGRRWFVVLAAVSLAILPALVNADDATLIQDLDKALTESEAQALMAPYMDQLKTVPQPVVEKIVMRQWWVLARELVAKSHTQGVDLSFSVRKAVRALKEEADELLRTLNPKYGKAQQVAPAFQWAQNDTSVFLTIKYTVRWNAPGALEVTEPSCNMTGNTFNFTGLGKHSNNKYKYLLSLNLFDNIDGAHSTWNAASVGKLSVMLRKKWARKWPRLIANKKTKIGNMHMWSERQENLDSTLSGMTTASNSPITCKAQEKLYCLATDTCKKADSCSQCPGKHIPKLDEDTCTGLPSEKASLNFNDHDMDENEVSGDIKITKARNDFDIDTYNVFWGKDDHNKMDGPVAMIGTAPAIGADTEVKLPSNTAIPEGATHLLVFSTNAHGEFATPGSALLSDAVLPKGKPTGLEFEDEDGDKNEVGGTVTIGKADNLDRVDEYSLHWGKSEKRKTGSGSLIRDVRKLTDKDATHHINSNTKIPDSATHILVFTKNKFGEHPHHSFVKIVDRTKPCLKDIAGDDCPGGATVSPDADPDANQAQTTITILPAKKEDGLTHYSIYWGRHGCEKGSGQSGAKNGHIRDHPVGEKLEVEIDADTAIPKATTHILVFTKSKYGESDQCVSTEFKDVFHPKAEL